jgi:hypothetical protein
MWCKIKDKYPYCSTWRRWHNVLVQTSWLTCWCSFLYYIGAYLNISFVDWCCEHGEKWWLVCYERAMHICSSHVWINELDKHLPFYWNISDSLYLGGVKEKANLESFVFFLRRTLWIQLGLYIFTIGCN